MIEIFRARFESVDVQILNLASTTDVVLCETIWRFSVHKGSDFAMGVQDAFSFEGERIFSWRSYFDLKRLTDQIDLGEG